MPRKFAFKSHTPQKVPKSPSDVTIWISEGRLPTMGTIIATTTTVYVTLENL